MYCYCQKNLCSPPPSSPHLEQAMCCRPYIGTKSTTRALTACRLPLRGVGSALHSPGTRGDGSLDQALCQRPVRAARYCVHVSFVSYTGTRTRDSVSMRLSVCVCLFVSVCLSVCLSLSVSLSLSLCVLLCLSACLCLRLSPFCFLFCSSLLGLFVCLSKVTYNV